MASAASFAVGAAAPTLMVLVTPVGLLTPVVGATSLVFLAVLGAVGAKAGGSSLPRAMARVTFWGAFAMAVTAAVGALFGATVA
jgi:VIT1/CCC1 family predicted Fe2+/Mn2+ transporter